MQKSMSDTGYAKLLLAITCRVAMVVLVVCVFAQPAAAACSGSSPTRTAASAPPLAALRYGDNVPAVTV